MAYPKSPPPSAASGPSLSLEILNRSSGSLHFAVLQVPRSIDSSSRPTVLAWTVGILSSGQPGGPSRAVVTWKASFSAVVGYLQARPPATPHFLAVSTLRVGVESGQDVPVVYAGEFPCGTPQFEAATAGGRPGMMTLTTDRSIPSQQRQDAARVTLAVGIAMDDQPAATMPLLPALTYAFDLGMRHFIVAGAFDEGDVVDPAAVGQATEIVFGDATQRTVAYTPEGTFEILT